jgi:hypothetical protein
LPDLFGDAKDGGRDDGEPACHGLKNNAGITLDARRAAKDVGRVPEIGGVSCLSHDREATAGMSGQFVHQRPHFALVGKTVAPADDNASASAGNIFRKAAKSTNQVMLSLASADRAD